MAGTQGRKFTKQDHDQMVKFTNTFNREVQAAVNTQIAKQRTSSETVSGTFGGAYTEGLDNYARAGTKISGLITQINDAVTKAGNQLHQTGSDAGRSQREQAQNLGRPTLSHLSTP